MMAMVAPAPPPAGMAYAAWMLAGVRPWGEARAFAWGVPSVRIGAWQWAKPGAASSQTARCGCFWIELSASSSEVEVRSSSALPLPSSGAPTQLAVPSRGNARKRAPPRSNRPRLRSEEVVLGVDMGVVLRRIRARGRAGAARDHTRCPGREVALGRFLQRGTRRSLRLKTGPVIFGGAL